MKAIILAAVFAVCSCAKLPGGNLVQVIRDDRVGPAADGVYSLNLETDNGIILQESGSPGSVGQTNVQGSYAYIAPDGTHIEVRYVADENGFRAEGPHIPTPHPIPAHALEQIRFAEEQARLRASSGDNRQF